ncbi:hypothetical protein AB0I75_29390 [Streptomyces sp. NPDC050273]|uniref:hypothetical protein n=1 Tax=Streptomyces sp. NPDC050273 TaxID=3154933 RepID=UPI003416722D
MAAPGAAEGRVAQSGEQVLGGGEVGQAGVVGDGPVQDAEVVDQFVPQFHEGAAAFRGGSGPCGIGPPDGGDGCLGTPGLSADEAAREEPAGAPGDRDGGEGADDGVGQPVGSEGGHGVGARPDRASSAIGVMATSASA